LDCIKLINSLRLQQIQELNVFPRLVKRIFRSILPIQSIYLLNRFKSIFVAQQEKKEKEYYLSSKNLQ